MRNLFFKTARRTLWRHKSSYGIQVFNLSISLAACLIIYFIIEHEKSYDDFHPGSERIYRVVSEFNNAEGARYSQGSSWPVARALRNDFPDLKRVSSIFSSPSQQITIEEGLAEPKKYLEKLVFYAEPQFFDIFNFPSLQGNPQKTLDEPNQVLLTKSIAEKYFGNWQSAIGKTIRIGARRICKVGGILQDMPLNTDFPLEIVASYKTLTSPNFSDWVTSISNLHTYVALPEKVTAAEFDRALAGFVKKYKPAEYSRDLMYLQPLKDIHFNEKFGNFTNHIFSRQLLSTLTLIGLFLLLIACVNFVNLATAQAVSRSKEIGIRKVLGSNKKQLVFQFLTETFMLATVSIVASLGICYAVLPWMADNLGISVSPGLDGTLLILLIGTIMTVTLISGLYPALLQAGFNPITALQNKLTTKSLGGFFLRKGLVVFQFIIAQVFILCTVIVVRQVSYLKDAPMGFNTSGIVSVKIPRDSLAPVKMNTLKNQLLQRADVRTVSFGNYSPSDKNHWETDFRYENAEKRTDFSADIKLADADYFKTFGIQFVAGRPYRPSDTLTELVVNETLIKKLGIENPEAALGKRIKIFEPERDLPIVGVVKDYHSYSLDLPLAPVIMGAWQNQYILMNVQIDPRHTRQLLPEIEKQWNSLFPKFVYQYEFLEDKIDSFYKKEDQLSTIYRLFTLLAIVISCLGLYGLLSFITVKRLKEIGIRKVLGARVSSIVFNLSKELLLLVLLACSVSVPLSWYLIHPWLEQFAFRIEPGIEIFAFSVIGSLVLACMTVGYKTIKAARTNPVQNLKAQ